MADADLPSFHGIIGRSAAMQALFAEIERFAPVDVPVLIQGESGTGKELVAKRDPAPQRSARAAVRDRSTAPISRGSCSGASSSATSGARSPGR